MRLQIEIFERAVELAAGEREAYLTERCGDDAKLRGEVERMLAAEEAPGFLTCPPGQGLAALAEAPAPRRIGPYRVLGLLGRGGFSTVYRAEQLEPIRRVVALKVLDRLRFDSRARERFEVERQTLARLRHDAIAQVYDAGQTEEGAQFLAMELVDGAPITEWCDLHLLGVDERLAIFQRVCAAVEHAHQRGVVHRDLKPGNVLVQAQNGLPAPKVIDFGVAKLLVDDQTGAGTLTHEGVLIGTPAYMSPEQAAGGGVDTRTDVYALGVLLFELVTGDLPFARERLSTSNAAVILRILSEEEPRRLASVVRERADAAEIARCRESTVDVLVRSLRGDLEWIVRKALAKDPEQRYAAVSALVDDLERLRRNEPVLAREREAIYLARKFMVRHRLGVTLAAVALGFLALGIAGLLWALGSVSEARREALGHRDTAVLSAYAAHLAAARGALQIGDGGRARRHLVEAAREHRGWEWSHLAAQCESSLATIETGPSTWNVLWLDDERLLVRRAVEGGSAIEVRDVRTGAIERTRTIELAYNHLCFDRRTGRLAVSAGPGLELWDLKSWAEPVPLFLGDNDIRALALSPDGHTLASAENGGVVRLFDLGAERLPRILCAALENVQPPQVRHVTALALFAAGTRLVLGGTGGIEVRSVETGELLLARDMTPNDVRALALSPDERTLYASTDSLLAMRLDTLEVEDRWPLDDGIGELQLSPDGRTLYGGGGWIDGRLLAWDAGTLEVVSRFHGHRKGVTSLDLSPDGRYIATTSGLEGTLRIWPAMAPPSVRRLHVGWDVRDLAVSPDGEAIANVDRIGRIWVRSARTLSPQLEVDSGQTLFACALGAEEVFAGYKELLAVDRHSGAIRKGDPPPSRVHRLALGAGEDWLAGASERDKNLCLWRLPELELAHSLDLPVTTYVVWDPGRACFAVGGTDDRLRFVEPVSGEVVEECALSGGAWTVSWGGGRLMVGGRPWLPHILRLYDRRRDEFLPWGRPFAFQAVAISGDGDRIATGGANGQLTLWDLSGHELLVLDEPSAPALSVHFLLGGERLVVLSSASGTQSFLLAWDAPRDVRLDD